MEPRPKISDCYIQGGVVSYHLAFAVQAPVGECPSSMEQALTMEVSVSLCEGLDVSEHVPIETASLYLYRSPMISLLV